MNSHFEATTSTAETNMSDRGASNDSGHKKRPAKKSGKVSNSDIRTPSYLALSMIADPVLLPRKAPRSLCIPEPESESLDQRVEEVLSRAKLGYFDVNLSQKWITFDTITRHQVDEVKLKKVLASMIRQGVQKYRSPIVLLAEESKIINLSAARPDCNALAALDYRLDGKGLPCISGRHRLAALDQICAALREDIMALERDSAENAVKLEQKRLQLSGYQSWPALLYRHGQFFI